jgi:hypothetical protein
MAAFAVEADAALAAIFALMAAILAAALLEELAEAWTLANLAPETLTFEELEDDDDVVA